MQGNDAKSSYFTMSVAAFSVGSSSSSNSVAGAPIAVAVNYSASVNGIIYFHHGCSLKFDKLHSFDSCSFTVPFRVAGDYVFSATFTQNYISNGVKGKSVVVIANIIIDPLAEPEWARK